MKCMLEDRLWKFEAAPVNCCHVSRSETANVGSYASWFNIDDIIWPFEEKAKLAPGWPFRLG